jgi:hypothetical protein
MFSKESLHKMFFSYTLRNIERRKWIDFDFHREAFIPTLCKLNMIKWVEVDSEKYDKIFIHAPDTEMDVTRCMLRSSRYGHYTFTKCFPSSSTCQECFKYFCPCCEEGTNCMYGERHFNRRCSNIIDTYYPEIYDIETVPKRVFIYSQPIFLLDDKRPVVCSREIYGY